MMSEDLPQGVAEFVGLCAARRVTVPLEFVGWLAAAPRPLDVEQCAALHVAARSWTLELPGSSS